MASNAQDCLEKSTFEIKEGISLTGNLNKYQVIKILQYRNFGEIAECKNEKTGEILALKCIKNKFYHSEKQEGIILNCLRNLNLDKNNIVRFTECFHYKGWICFVFEKLTITFLEAISRRNGKPFHVEEIRPIAHQMLLALDALKNIGITHANVNPENIMFMDQNLKLNGVKLIGFGDASDTSRLSEMDIPLACGYSAPEVFLDCPLDQSVDMWGLGCTLAFLFTGQHLYPTHCDYDYIKSIVNFHGQPENQLLDKGCRVRRFFMREQRGPEHIWRFKTPTEFEQTTGSVLKERVIDCGDLNCLDDLLSPQEMQNPVDLKYAEAFIDLLKKMLTVDPAHRILPADALKHPFITMEHLDAINIHYVATGHKIMERCQPRTTVTNLQREQKMHSTLSASTAVEKIGIIINGSSETEESEETDDETTQTELTTLKLEPGIFIVHKSAIYGVEEILDAGTFGVVARCRKEETNEVVALKQMKLKHYQYYLKETKALKCLSNLKHYHNYFIKLHDHFKYEGCYFQVLELLDISLFDLLLRGCSHLKVAEIRVVAQQMLVALTVLKSFRITHGDIKPDNIMLVNQQSQPLRVKMIDFGCSCGTYEVSQNCVFQAVGYRAPEVHLCLPRSESVDMWGLGCVLAFLFLGRHLFPINSEYENLRGIVKLLGQPDKKLLDKGLMAQKFFTQEKSGPEHYWVLKTPEEFQQETGSVLEMDFSEEEFLTSLDDLLHVYRLENPTEFRDVKAFVDLLRKMLAMNLADRIQPTQALKHPFITMEHLNATGSTCYVATARDIMEKCCPRNPDCVPVDGERENTSCASSNTMLTDDSESDGTESVSDGTNFSTNEELDTLMPCTKKPERENTSQPDPSKMPANDSQLDDLFEFDESTFDTNSQKEEREYFNKKISKLVEFIDNRFLDLETDKETDKSDLELEDATTHTESITLESEQGFVVVDKPDVSCTKEVLGCGPYEEVFRHRKRKIYKPISLKVISVSYFQQNEVQNNFTEKVSTAVEGKEHQLLETKLSWDKTKKGIKNPDRVPPESDKPTSGTNSELETLVQNNQNLKGVFIHVKPITTTNSKCTTVSNLKKKDKNTLQQKPSKTNQDTFTNNRPCVTGTVNDEVPHLKENANPLHFVEVKTRKKTFKRIKNFFTRIFNSIIFCCRND